MMIEDYCSFETSKLLKEKGFPQEPMLMYGGLAYKENGKICPNPKSAISWRPKYWYYCATHQTAMRWLREKHKLFIEIRAVVDGSNIWYDFDIMSLEERAIKPDDTIYEFNTYGEAAETAIKYCLENLIK